MNLTLDLLSSSSDAHVVSRMRPDQCPLHLDPLLSTLLNTDTSKYVRIFGGDEGLCVSSSPTPV